jgi:ubiquinol-cytochrome c reductase iron-sulfur subunit
MAIELKADRRRFMTRVTGALVGLGATVASIPLFRSLRPGEHLSIPTYMKEIDISGLQPGEVMTLHTFKGPIYVLRRTDDQIQSLEKFNDELVDPHSNHSEQPDYTKNDLRSIRPDIFVGLGTCTHLGCSVEHYGPDKSTFWNRKFFEAGGFYCPCHGAMYDSAGRVYKNLPAPKNLRVPQHEFVSETKLRLTGKGAI